MSPIKKLKSQTIYIIGLKATTQICPSIGTQDVEPIAQEMTRQNDPKDIPYTLYSIFRQPGLASPYINPSFTQVSPLNKRYVVLGAISHEAPHI